MTLSTFPFNGTNGAAATNANTGAFGILTGTNSSQSFSTTASYQGATGLHFVSDGTAVAAARFKFAGSASATQASFSARIKIPSAIPAVAQALLQIDDTTGTRVLQIQYTASGVLKTNDKANTGVFLLTSAQATPGTWVRVEVVITALSATAGAFTARAYSFGSTQVGTTASSTTANLGTTAMGGATIGIPVATPMSVDIDSLQMDNGRTTEIGEYSPNSTLPTIDSISANQTVVPGATVSLAATARAYNGDTISTWSWIVESAIDNFGQAMAITLAAPDTASPSFTLPAGKFGRVIVGLTVIDSSGNVSVESLTKVFIPSNTAGVIEVTSSTGWTGSAVANVDDSNDSTYAESGGPGSGSVLIYRLAPMTPAVSKFELDIKSMVQAVGGTQQVELLEGGTVRKNFGALSPGTAMADQLINITDTATLNTINSWNELDLRLTQV